MKCLVTRQGSFARCANCPNILYQLKRETPRAFAKRIYCSRKCREAAAEWRNMTYQSLSWL